MLSSPSNDDARIWMMRSRDLEGWSEPEPLRLRGPDVAEWGWPGKGA
jgi:hypothetical protein